MKKHLFALAALLSATTLFAAQKPIPKLTLAQARTLALQHESGKVQSGELEKEHGRWIYSFDIQTAKALHEVNIDANTGKLVEDSVEDPAAEAREKQQEATHPKP